MTLKHEVSIDQPLPIGDDDLRLACGRLDSAARSHADAREAITGIGGPRERMLFDKGREAVLRERLPTREVA